MASGTFHVVTHQIEGQHIRGNDGSCGDDNIPSKLEIKQYIPKNKRASRPGDITIIATHCSGYTKELYEPMFADLVACFSSSTTTAEDGTAFFGGPQIRSIWMADTSHMGYSGALNAQNLGENNNFFDHSRDLLCMVNTFRTEMPAPIIGLGHSMGTISLAFLSFMHPRLFAALIFIETIMYDRNLTVGEALRKSVARKDDFWPNMEEAKKSVMTTPFYRSWDPRVLERYFEHGFCSTPNVIFPDRRGVTTLTSKHQELQSSGPLDCFTRAECVQAFNVLPHLEPPVLWVQATNSPMTDEAARKRRLQLTGIAPPMGRSMSGEDVGHGGSGGVSAGRVVEKVLPGSHFLPFDNPRGTAEAAASFLGEHVGKWAAKEKEWRKTWGSKSTRERQTYPDRVMDMVAAGKERQIAPLGEARARI